MSQQPKGSWADGGGAGMEVGIAEKAGNAAGAKTSTAVECGRQTFTTRRGRGGMARDLTQIRENANKEPETCFTSIDHYVTDEGNLYASYWDLEPGKAPGIDGVTREGYGEDLDKNITDLALELARMGYRPKPVKRVYIPKPGSDKKRPLGIPCFEDKLVQKAVARVLEPI